MGIIKIDVEYPTEVAAGDRFDIKAEVTNTSSINRSIQLRLVEAVVEGLVDISPFFIINAGAMKIATFENVLMPPTALSVYIDAVDSVTETVIGKSIIMNISVPGIAPPPPPPVGMAAILYGIAAVFHDIATNISGVWVIGEYLAYPFKYVGDHFDSAGDAWLDFETYIGDLWTAIAAFLSWTEIKTKIDATYDIITHTWSEVTGAISTAVSTAISGLSDIVDHTWSEVTGAVDTAIKGLSDIVDHTWSEVTGAISTAIAGLSDIVDHTWSEVTGAISAEAAATKEWFFEQEEMVYGWISEKWVDKILDLIDAKVDHFKDKLWDLVEKIMERI